MLPFYRVVQEEQPALNFVAIQDDIERFWTCIRSSIRSSSTVQGFQQPITQNPINTNTRHS